MTRPARRTTTRRSEVHVPVRVCAGCGLRAPKHALRRFGAIAGTLAPVPRGGRGVYTCDREECFERARVRRAFARTLRVAVTVEGELARNYTEVLHG